MGLFHFLLGGILTAACLVVGWLALRSSHRRHKLMRAAVHAGGLSKEALQKLWGADLGGLPGFLSAPDTAQVLWLNTALDVLWPHIDRAGTSWAFQDRRLEELLNSQSFWKPAWLAASGVVLQSLMLGQSAPRVTGMKVYPPEQGHASKALVLDVTFDWASKMQVQLAMKTLPGAPKSTVDRLLSLVYSTLSVTVRVRDLVARGQLRIAVTPLLDALPVAGAVRVSFLGPPAVSYHVSSFGANPMLIPGLDAWLNSFIRGQVLQPFTFPEALVVDVGKLLGLGATAGQSLVRPEGLVSVTVHRADNVPRTDFFGLSDPYVKLFLSERHKRRTSVKANTLSPVWNEQFEFVVHSAEHERLMLELWDSDAFKPDDIIGRVEVALSSLDLTPGARNYLDLPVPRMGKKRRKSAEEAVVVEQGGAGSGIAAAPKPTRIALAPPHQIASPFVDGPHTGGVPAAESPAAGSAAAAAAAAAAEGPAATPSALVAAPTLQRARRVQTGRFERLQRTAAAKLEGAFSTKECTLHLTLQYFPFTSADATAAMQHKAGLQPSLANVSHRLQRVIRGGMLYVQLIRAEGLPSSRAITKQFRVKVKVGPRSGGEPHYKKTAERTGVGRGLSATDPVFDQTLDFLIDGDTAHAGDTVITVELWVVHLLLKPTFKGRVTMPLAKVMGAGRLHDTFLMEDVASGRLEMALEWLGAMQAA